MQNLCRKKLRIRSKNTALVGLITLYMGQWFQAQELIQLSQELISLKCKETLFLSIFHY